MKMEIYVKEVSGYYVSDTELADEMWYRNIDCMV